MDTIDGIDSAICGCRKCRLWKTAKKAVPGEGPPNAKAMLVGQNPGREENESGRPFIGRSGKYLTKALEANGIKREELYITSVLKHWTPDNRKPFQDEVDACLPYLMRQIDSINPKIVLLLGQYAWNIPRKNGIRYIETYHPAAAMRFAKIREKFSQDIREFAKEYKKL